MSWDTCHFHRLALRLFHFVSGCYEVTSLIIMTNLSFGEGRKYLVMPK